MLQLATPPDRPRPALLASLGVHLLAFSAMGLGPLLAFPEAPGWEGAVWVVTQPVMPVVRETTPVDLRDREARRSEAAGGGGLPSAPHDGARPATPTFQPGLVPEALPELSAEEPAGDDGITGGIEDGNGTRVGPGSGVPGGGTGADPIDLRGGEPPDLVLPSPVETPSPRYSDAARIARVAGVVVLSATIAADGRVVDVVVESSANPLLERSAVEAVSRWRYRPATVGGHPVAVILRVTLTFRLV